MIKSWGNHEAEQVFKGQRPRTLPADIMPRARRLLLQLHAATSLNDLRSPPGNRLHQLTGNMAGRWSVSVNMQYRVTFVWNDGNAEDVWLGDYH